MASNYAGGQYREYTLMLRQRIAELPSFCAEFFRGIENETLVRTRYAYAGDLRNFFRYITTELPDLKGKCILELTLADLDRISVTEIEMYLAHVSYYMDEEHRNHQSRPCESPQAFHASGILQIFLQKGEIEK